MSEGAVIKKAPVGVGALVLVASLVVWTVVNWHYAGVIAEKDALIDRLRSEIGAPGKKVERDPDGIYQYDSKVGKVVAPDLHISEGFVQFGTIIADGNFNKDAEFEYRGFRLKIESAAIVGTKGTFGRIQEQDLAQVKARVLGARQ